VSAQLPLFAPAAEPAGRLGGGPPDVQRRFELAFTEPVKLELLAVAADRPEDWLRWKDFRAPMEEHKIGFCMGHVLSQLVREGRLQERTFYYGKGLEADRPGSADYQGYNHEWQMICAPRTQGAI
jgi:hypothetical protein